MLDSTRPSEPAGALSVTVRLILDDPEDAHVRGRVEQAGQHWEFSGWLALLSHLERLARLPASVDQRQE
jgi:hypothetical protein